ncbi:uncharacterized protein [Parasteatoda tepidariorum]|nr:uncharacterized protein LOC107442187 [Parasteatoda tepidariorum]XP_015911179.2 uncharacterized protein LOC107442187 [Parasteatoda tepidariorum]
MLAFTVVQVLSVLLLLNVLRSDGQTFHYSSPREMQRWRTYSPLSDRLKYSTPGGSADPSVLFIKIQSGESTPRAVPIKTLPHSETTSGSSQSWLEARSSPDVAQSRGLFERRSILPTGIFNRPMISNWNERVRNSFSNAFSSILPSASSGHASFLPFHQQRYQHGTGNPFMNYHPQHSMNYHLQHSMNYHPQHSNQHFMSTFPVGAASYGQPQAVAFPPNFNAGHQRFLPSANFVHYAKSIPKHTPLFNNAGGLKGAALEINNAFADFTDSSEHGPEVTQKFGSVGHTMSTFLNMMGLGPAGGITDDWTSMDDSAMARSSLDFYPGYGNQAHLDDINDYPIFLQDMTEHFLTKMNLTDVLNKVKEEKASKVGNVKSENLTEAGKLEKSTPHIIMQNSKTAVSSGELKVPTMSEPVHVTEKIKINKTMVSGKNEQTYGGKYSNSSAVEKKEYMMNPSNKKESPTSYPTVTNSKRIQDGNNTNNKEYFAKETPSADYRIPSVFSPVSPKDRKKPIAIYKKMAPEFPHEKNSKVSDNVEYVPAHPLTNHESEINENKLINEDVVRQWVSITEGKNYVEKHPKPIIDFGKDSSEQPKSFSILKEVLRPME